MLVTNSFTDTIGNAVHQTVNARSTIAVEQADAAGGCNQALTHQKLPVRIRTEEPPP